MLDAAKFKSSEAPLAVEWPEPVRQFDVWLPGGPLKIAGNLLVCDFGFLNLETGAVTDMPGFSYEDAVFGFLLGDDSIVHYCEGISEKFPERGFYVGRLDKAERKFLSSASFNSYLGFYGTAGDHAFVYAKANLAETALDVYCVNARDDKTDLLFKDCQMARNKLFFPHAMAFAWCISNEGKSSLVTKRGAGDEIIPLEFEEHGNTYKWNDWMLVVSKDHSTVQIFEVGSIATKSIGVWTSQNSTKVFPCLNKFKAFSTNLCFGTSDERYPVVLRFNSGALAVYRLRVPQPIVGIFDKWVVGQETICLTGNVMSVPESDRRVLVYEAKPLLKQIELAIESAGQ